MSVPHRYFVLVGWIATLATVGCAVGCSGANSSSTRQFDEMRREIHAVQSNNDRLNERVTALELASAGGAKKHAAAHGEERPDLEVIHLSPGDDPGDPDPREPDAREPAAREPDAQDPEDDDAPSVVIHAEGRRVPSVRRGHAPDPGASGVKAAREYDRALKLVDHKRYDAALEALAGFLVRYPGHPNADNAMYWRGECYYAKGNYVRAVEQFEGLLSRFPHGNKVPDALLKLGLSLRHMGEREKAAKTFEQLRKGYANSDAAKKIPRE